MDVILNGDSQQKLLQMPKDDAEKIAITISRLKGQSIAKNVKKVESVAGDIFYIKSGNYRIGYTCGNQIEIFQIESRDHIKEQDNSLVFSYMTLRNLIGFSGMALPFLLIFFTTTIAGERRYEPSISDYYYTNTGDILVVVLCVLGTFLFTYNGYNRKEKFWMILAAVCGMGVAFSPTGLTETLRLSSVHTGHTDVVKVFGLERHLWFAAAFFIALSIISLVYFPKTDTTNPHHTTKNKRNRNVIFKTCGIIMLTCVGIIGLYFGILNLAGASVLKSIVGDKPIVFIFETIAIEAFGFSWITKGETIFPDHEHYMVKAYKKARHLALN